MLCFHFTARDEPQNRFAPGQWEVVVTALKTPREGPVSNTRPSSWPNTMNKQPAEKSAGCFNQEAGLL